MCLGNTYLGPKSSAEHSLRFRDSTLAGSDEFSLTPLILNAYQRLEMKHRNIIFLVFFSKYKHKRVVKLCFEQKSMGSSKWNQTSLD